MDAKALDYRLDRTQIEDSQYRMCTAGRQRTDRCTDYTTELCRGTCLGFPRGNRKLGFIKKGNFKKHRTTKLLVYFQIGTQKIGFASDTNDKMLRDRCFMMRYGFL